MAPITIDDINVAFENTVLPELVSQLHEDVLFWKLIQKAGKIIPSMKQTKVKVRYEHTQGLGARAYTDDIPDAGHSRVTECFIPLAAIYGRVQAYDLVMRLTKMDPNALIEELDDEMESLFIQVRKDIQRMYFGDGTGVLATVAAANGGGTAVTVDSTWQLPYNAKVDIVRGGAVVSAANEIAGIGSAITATLGTGFSVLVGDIIVRNGAYNKEMQGLEQIIANTGTFQGIITDNNYWWAANVDDNGGVPGDIDLKRIHIMWNTCRTRGTRTKPTLIVTTPDICSAVAYIAMHKLQYQSAGGPVSYNIGWEGVVLEDKKFLEEPDCTPQTMYFLNVMDLIRDPVDEPDWLRDGAGVLRLARGVQKAMYEALLVYYDNLGAKRRNGMGKITNILGISDGSYPSPFS